MVSGEDSGTVSPVDGETLALESLSPWREVICPYLRQCTLPYGVYIFKEVDTT